jgi:pyrroloquinoline quinone biosynthesis protein B
MCSAASVRRVIVRILGSAAGGGVPQWNCSCANCRAARDGRRPRRSQSTVAVSADGRRWLLLNCSPDIAAQIEAFAPLHPNGLRTTPIDGMLFTDANVDHLGGLATLRQRGGHRFILRSSEVVRGIALSQPAFAPFASSPHRWLAVPEDAACEPADGADLVGNQLRVRALAVSGTTPGYAGRRSLAGAVVAYEIAGRAEGPTLLFAPVFSKLDDSLRAAIERAQWAILDGTFYSEDELVSARLVNKTARELGHQPVGGPDGTLERLRGCRTRMIFTHLNNSNPMLDPSSDAFAAVREFGAEVAYDGMTLEG